MTYKFTTKNYQTFILKQVKMLTQAENIKSQRTFAIVKAESTTSRAHVRKSIAAIDDYV